MSASIAIMNLMQRMRLTFFAVVLSLFSLLAQSQNSNNILHELITASLENPYHYLSEEKIVWLNPIELKQLENFIYAREFPAERDSNLLVYFKKSDSILTNEIMKSEEFIQATRYNLSLLSVLINHHSFYAFVEGTLTGDWQEGSSVTDAGSSTIFSFYAGDQSFSFDNGNPKKGDRLYSYSGFYTLDSSNIELEIRYKENWVGGEIMEPENAASENEWELSGAELVLTELQDGYEYQTMSISQIHVITFDDITKMYLFLDGEIYWKIMY